MDKTKVVPLILLLIILIVGFIAYRFYAQTKSLAVESERVKKEKGRLIEEREKLTQRYNQLEKEKEEIEKEWLEMKDEIASLDKETRTWKGKYERVVEERDRLIEKLKEKPRVEFIEKKQEAKAAEEEYWADFIKKKAELETQLADLKKEFITSKDKISEMENANKELSIKIDELIGAKEDLEKDVRFKEKTMKIMGRDLVSEREEKKSALEELNKLREENVSLKRELVLANKKKMEMQGRWREMAEKKGGLEERISDAERILKERATALEELQEQLGQAIKGEKNTSAKETDSQKPASQESASVELPPIVVEPETPSMKGLLAQVIAVNNEERFIVIDKGESSGVKRGLRMKVTRGGREIATVKVIETRKEISAADIQNVSHGATIREGDRVVSK